MRAAATVGRALAAALAVGCATAAAGSPPLDPYARAMLDPKREALLHPDAIIARIGLPEDAVVADVGAGPGFLTLRLARALPRGRVIATDIREPYLDALLVETRAVGLDNVETRLVPHNAPGLAPRSVDAAILCQVDHYLPDRVVYLRALISALRPGGRIVLVNDIGHRAAALAAAQRAGLVVVDEWRPSPLYFAAIFVPAVPR